MEDAVKLKNLMTYQQYVDKEEEKTVEKEDTGSGSLMDKPFNPKQIDIKTRQMTLDLLIKRLSAEPVEIDLYPDFQRRDDLWNDEKQSQLIESVLINFPLPAFYFDGTDDNKWLVVDGLQRLSTLRNFVITKKLTLEGLEFLNKLNGKKFDDLSRPLQRQIEETTIVAYIINPGTPNEVKFNIFKRVNTGGLLMEPQEIRHAMNQGIPAKTVADLASQEAFKKATEYIIKTERMLDREFATRFVSFYITDYNDYRPDLDTFMNQSMADIKKMTEKERNEMKRKFIEAMKAAKEIFGNWAFRKADKYPERRKPINKALFEVWSVSLAKLSDSERVKLVSNKQKVLNDFVELNKTDTKFNDSITSTTGDKTRVIYRYTAIENLIQNNLLA